MEFGSDEIETKFLCLGCLGTGRMYNIRQYNLLEPYLLLTGLKIPENVQTNYFCQFCSTLLKKYKAFREKCLRSFEYLTITRNKISKKLLSHEIISQYTINEVLDSHYFTEDDTIDMKYDIKNDNSDGNELNYHSNITGNYDIITKNNADIYCDVKCKHEKQMFTNKSYDHKKNDKDSDKKYILTSNLDSKHKKIEKSKTELKKRINKTVTKTKLSKKQPFRLSTEEGRRIFEEKYSVSIKIMSEEEKITDLKERYVEIYGGVECALCYKKFKNEKMLTKHTIDMHDASKPMSCKYCGYRTDTSRSLQYHTVRNHKYKLTCHTCGLLIRTPNSIAEHHRTHSGQTFTCRFCRAVWKTSKQYRLHLRKAHPSRLIWCNVCGEVYISLENHLKASHKNVLKSKFKCTKCNAYFISEEVLDKHERAQTDTPCDKCCYHCAESFTNEDLLRQHFEKNHKLAEKTIDRPKKKPLLDKSNTNGTGGVCDVCGKRLRTNNGLEYHMLIHSGAWPHACQRCGKKFRCKMSLENHCRVHSGERPFSCELCRKAFRSQSGLYRHRRVHTGEKIHQCDICSKFYSTSSGLKSHVKSVHMKMPPNI